MDFLSGIFGGGSGAAGTVGASTAPTLESFMKGQGYYTGGMDAGGMLQNPQIAQAAGMNTQGAGQASGGGGGVDWQEMLKSILGGAGAGGGSKGSTIGSIGGAGIGAFFGQPMIGAQLGGMVGGAFDKKDKKEPEAQDNGVSQMLESIWGGKPFQQYT